MELLHRRCCGLDVHKPRALSDANRGRAVSRYRRANIAALCALSADRDHKVHPYAAWTCEPGGAAVINNVNW